MLQFYTHIHSVSKKGGVEFLPERDYVMCGYSPSQFRLSSSVCNVRASYSTG